MKPEQYEMVLELLEFAKRNNTFYLTTRDFREFEVEVEDACEKQIPKKVTFMSEYLCGNCNVTINSEDCYCYNCGQQIDWSVQE